MVNPVPETSYAKCGDRSLAYQVFGDGPVELVYAGSFISHVELFWTMPEFEAFMEQLGGFCRVLLFDKAGVGLSDPVPRVRTLDDRAAEIEAVMDAVGFGKAVIFGLSEGGPAAMVFAATRPQRTRALILTGTYAFTGFAGWDDMDRDPAELRARVVPELGEDYTPSTEQIARDQELGRAIRSAWGSGAALKGLLPSVRSLRQLGMLERMSASPGMARATLESAFRIDVRPILPTITAPTLIIHARDESFRCRAAGTSPTTSLAHGCSKSTAWTTCPGSSIPTGSPPRSRSSSPAATRHPRSHIAPCARWCSPTWSPRHNTPRRPATSGGVRCSTALVRSPPNSRNDSEARW